MLAEWLISIFIATQLQLHLAFTKIIPRAIIVKY